MDLNADVLGICEFDCLEKEIRHFNKEANDLSKHAGSDLLNFMKDQMKYDHVMIEKDGGLCATAVFYKREILMLK